MSYASELLTQARDLHEEIARCLNSANEFREMGERRVAANYFAHATKLNQHLLVVEGILELEGTL